MYEKRGEYPQALRDRDPVRAAERFALAGLPQGASERLHAPAGLDIGAITPEEIAVSILAEITVLRRRGQREA